MRTHFRTIVLSLLAIALFVWFLARVDLAAVAASIRRARLDLILWSAAMGAVMPVVRTVRWRYLLEPIGPARFSAVLRATILGFAALVLLPARAGDVIRPYLVGRSEGLNTASAFATIVMERVLDLITVLTLLSAFVWLLGGGSALAPQVLRPLQVSAAIGAAAVVVLMTVMWTLATHPERVERLVLRSERLFPARVAQALSRLARTFSEGFAVAREPRALGLALVWSFPLWFSIAFQAWLVTRAFGIAMPFSGSFLVQSALVIGVAVPTPGGVGGFHQAYRLAVTTFFHAPDDAAVGAALVLHAVTFVTSLLPGIAVMARDGLSVSGLGQLAGAAREEERAEADEMPVLRKPGR